MELRIICRNCNAELNPLQRSLTCPQCSANQVEFQLIPDKDFSFQIENEQPGIWRFSSFLPKFEKIISLNEGNTPLRKATNLSKEKMTIYLKLEGANPTGSFLDRVSPLMVSDALTQGKKTLVCASDGNLGASISAYAASAGLKCVCVVPKSTSPEKKVQMTAYGAEIVDYGDTIDDSLVLAKKMTDQKSYQATPEFNLLNIEGAKTISFEIIEQFNNYKKTNSNVKWFDYIVVPLGSGRLLYSIWKGFQEAKRVGFLQDTIPKIIGVQVKGFDSISTAIQTGSTDPKPVATSHESTLADAISTKQSIFSSKAIQSINDSGGTSIVVSEKQILNASKKLGKEEGVFAEISSATVIAAIYKLVDQEYFNKKANILALITASGLKTSQAFDRSTSRKKRVESFRSMGTKIEILHVIESSEANFGYGIWKVLGQVISLQAVYQHLKELQAANHIEEIKTNNRQKQYQLTKKGKQLIQKMKELEELLP